MSDKTFDTLKQPESTAVDLNSFDNEQLDAVVIYLAKRARSTRHEHNMTEEYRKNEINHFSKLWASWPKEFCDRVNDRVREAALATDYFWAKPADAMIAATKAVELA